MHFVSRQRQRHRTQVVQLRAQCFALSAIYKCNRDFSWFITVKPKSDQNRNNVAKQNRKKLFGQKNKQKKYELALNKCM